ncbi:MAG: PadR family transcriptional regulator [Candidatus Hodarchaeales archaeon]|jgi:PadR family transcriptional regulator PadR
MKVTDSTPKKSTQRLVTLTDRIEKDAKGSLNAILILGIIRMKGNTWGYQIKKILKELTGGRYQIKDSSLYTILSNLEDKYRLISSTKESKLRYYSLTNLGVEEIKRACIYWQDLMKISDDVFEKIGLSQILEVVEIK